jgi:hypothetical protein
MIYTTGHSVHAHGLERGTGARTGPVRQAVSGHDLVKIIDACTANRRRTTKANYLSQNMFFV